jgi:uncharacterized protein
VRIVLFALLALAFATPAVAADFKIPPTPDHYVTDNAGALSSSAQTTIDNELQAYEKATGHQILVWIGDTTGDVPLETWTGDTAHQWRIGRKGHDDGAVLFVFMKDRKIRIEVGYGLESSLTDAASYRIINDVIRPRMRSGDVDGAVSSGVAAMLKTITPDYSGVTPPPSSESNESNLPPAAAIVIFIGFALLMLFVAFIIIMQVVGSIRYGYLVLREGSTKARQDMKHWLFWGAAGGLASGGSWSSGGDGFGGGGGGFSAGGGDFGGGGASGGW